MRIICILGRSGSGKSSIEKALESVGYNRIISYTTRKPRGNEKDGEDYNFVSREEFKSLISKGILMEHTEYSGNMYGAPKPVGSINNVIVTERKGYLKIKELYGNQAIGVYVDTPIDIIKNRLNIRNDLNDLERIKRFGIDSEQFKDIENEVDLIIDGSQSVNESLANILRYIKSRR